jgi:hypothetical protein
MLRLMKFDSGLDSREGPALRYGLCTLVICSLEILLLHMQRSFSLSTRIPEPRTVLIQQRQTFPL